MSETETTQYQDYNLVCGARPVDQGRFAPTLTVSRRAWPSRPRVIAVVRDTFETEANAIEAARTQGIQWVTDFG